MKELVRSGVEELVDWCCDHCAAILARIDAFSNVETASEPTLNQRLLRLTQVRKTPEENDEYIDLVIREINDIRGITREGSHAADEVVGTNLRLLS